MQEAYFSNIRSRILPLLASARENVSVAMAWFTSAELFDALLNCIHRGVRVDVILLDDAINFMSFAPDFNRLIESGGKLRIAKRQSGFLHHKFCVVDGKTVITGSYNWTYYAETRNIENIIISDDPHVVGLYLREYEQLKASFLPTDSYSQLSWNEIEAMEDVNFQELNYEVERLCAVQNRPFRKAIKTHVVTRTVETRLQPFSGCDIGILEQSEGDSEPSLRAFIKAHSPLPCKSATETFFFDSKAESFFSFFICYGDRFVEMKENALMEMIGDIKDENVQLNITMTLHEDGHLYVEVDCPTSGKKHMISPIEPSLVKYE